MHNSCRYECSRRNRRGNPTLNATHWNYVTKLAAITAKYLATNTAVMSSSNHRELLLATITRKTHFIRHPKIGVKSILHINEEQDAGQKDLSSPSVHLCFTHQLRFYGVFQYPQRLLIRYSRPSHWVRERRCIPSSFSAPSERNWCSST